MDEQLPGERGETFSAGWHPDPYGRAQHRYWDGGRWTEHIANGGQSSVDPLGSSTIIPFTLPTGIADSPASAAGPVAAVTTTSGTASFFDVIGEPARQRPKPTLRGAFGATGGAVLTVGLFGIVLGGDDPSAAVGAVVAALVIVVAGFARSKAETGDHDLRSVSVAMAGISILTFAAAVTESNAGTTTFLVAGALFLVGWFIPPFRGTPMFLGAGTLAVVLGLAFAMVESSNSRSNGGLGDILDVVGDQTRSAGIFLLVATVVLAIVAYRLDTRGYLGATAPLLLAAMVSALIGVGAVGATLDGTGAYFIAGIAGALLAVVGARGAHRATTWFGAGLGSIGLVAAIFAVATPSSARGTGALALFVGLVIAVAPRVIDAIRHNSDNSDNSDGSGGYPAPAIKAGSDRSLPPPTAG